MFLQFDSVYSKVYFHSLEFSSAYSNRGNIGAGKLFFMEEVIGNC